jgi:nucleoid DNA-binding protein
MSKVGNKELSSSLSDKHGLNKTDAERFVAAIFEVINEGLESDKLVKVKGLGTFKIIGVAARKSVDVNTGEPIVIEGRDKISFTPDATLRDEVNKPFSQFDTVVLNDGVDFSNIDKEFEEDPEAAVLKAIGENTVSETRQSNAPTQDASLSESTIAKEAVSDIPTFDDKPEEEAKEEEKEETVESAKEGSEKSPVSEEQISQESTFAETVAEKPLLKESSIDKEPVQADKHEDIEEKNEVVEKKTEDKQVEPQPEYDEEIVEEHQNNTLKVLIIAAAVIVIGCIGGGYYLFKQIEKRDSHIELLEKQMKIVAQNQKKSNVAHTQHQSTSNPVDSLKASTASQAKTAESVKTETEEESNEKALQVKYNRDPRIRTGAYIITGIKKTVTVRAGQTMNGISRTALGPGMECYVEAVNGGQRELKEGEKINIPSLKLKKRK